MQLTPSDTVSFICFITGSEFGTPVAVHLQQPEILSTIYVQYHVLFVRAQKIAGIFTSDGVLYDCSAVFVTPGFGYSVFHFVQDVVVLLFFSSGILQQSVGERWLSGESDQDLVVRPQPALLVV